MRNLNKKFKKKCLVLAIILISFIIMPVQSSIAAENISYTSYYNFSKGLTVSGNIGSLREIDSDYLIAESQYTKFPTPTQAFCGNFFFPSVHADVLRLKIIVSSSSDWFIDIIYSDGTILSKIYQDNNWVELGIEINCQKIVDHIEIYSFGDEYLGPFTVKIDQIILVSSTSIAELEIITPVETELFGTSPPGYEIEISYSFNLERAYYTINDQLSPEYLIDLTSWVSGTPIFGTIDDNAWNNLEDGEVTITFTVITDFETETTESVVIIKDSTSPSITILTPEEGQKFGINTPEYQIEIIDESLIESKWYVIEDSNPIDFTLNSGIIEQSIWGDLVDSESINIEFYAQDITGNIDHSTVVVSKDSSPPEITINSPSSNQMFSITPPNYDIFINEDALEYGFKIDNGIEYQLNSLNGNIYQTSWDWLDQGIHQLTFYAVDYQGNKGYNTVEIYKDSIDPNLNVIAPIEDDVYGITAPNYSLSIFENNLQDFGYFIDGSSSFIVNNLTGKIDQNTWNLLDQGTHSIDFWVRDLAGNVRYNSVYISKDTDAPIININSPNNNIYDENGLYYDIDVFDQNPDEVWYMINNDTSSKYYISSATGFIDQNAYSACDDGEILITFFASDIVDNIAQSSVLLIKDSINPQISIISPKIEDIFGQIAPYYEIDVEEENLIELYYRVNDGTYRIISDMEGFINQYDWSNAPCGDVSIKFFAIDSINHETIEEIIIKKDTISPSINIILPETDEISGKISPNFKIEIDESNLKDVWYTLNSNSTKYNLNSDISIEGHIDQEIYDILTDGLVIINFYAEDNLGNIGLSSVSIIKDASSPMIEINSPVEFNFYDGIVYYEIEIDELNLNEIYYTVSMNSTRYQIYEPIGYIDINLWNSLDDGVINISFIAIDLAGNIVNQTVSIVKDTIEPLIEILSPQPFEEFNSSIAPTFLLNIVELNLDKIYYTIGNRSEFYYVENNSSDFTIEQDLWDLIPIGKVEFTISVQDLSNHTTFRSIIIEKIDIQLGSNEFDVIELLKIPLPVSFTIFSGAAIIIIITNKIRKKKLN